MRWNKFGGKVTHGKMTDNGCAGIKTSPNEILHVYVNKCYTKKNSNDKRKKMFIKPLID